MVKPKIQGPAAVGPGKAAHSRAEAMNQPGSLRKGIGAENFARGDLGNLGRHCNILATSLPKVSELPGRGSLRV